MMRRFVTASSIAACLFFSACAPADVAGNYTVNVTNGPDECMTGGWTEGESTSGIPVVVTQDGDQVVLEVQGLTGTFLTLGVGSNRFQGQVSGSGVTAALIGSVSRTQGMCTYTTTVDLDARVDDDVIQGTLRYRPVTNGHPDCGILETCGNQQSFNGARPPGS
jgi:hypothetical protein